LHGPPPPVLVIKAFEKKNAIIIRIHPTLYLAHLDFNKLLKFYLKNYKKVKNKPKILKTLKESHNNLLIKKRKLKTGSITFIFKTFTFQGISISQWFEMEYHSQPTSNQKRKDFEKSLNTLNLKKDIQSITLVVFTFLFFILYINYLFEFYI
jgi:hypothetical protein